MTQIQLAQKLKELVNRGAQRRDKTSAVMYFALKYTDELKRFNTAEILEIIQISLNRRSGGKGWLAIIREAQKLSQYVRITKDF
ncbi:MAG: hypothetical protein MJ187_03930 [Alphaproteobacteria bacterium]|nr:hypothetical protein [Alphaproteobacteria bacterium]